MSDVQLKPETIELLASFKEGTTRGPEARRLYQLDLINIINGAHKDDCKSEEEFWTRRTDAIRELETISGCTFKRQSDITALHNKLKHEAP
jgi:hypothetical protein